MNLTSQLVLYIQMKLCDCTLKQWITERAENIFQNQSELNDCVNINIDDKLNLSIFRQILEAVNYIHSRGIIHRDLKVNFNTKPFLLTSYFKRYTFILIQLTVVKSFFRVFVYFKQLYTC